MFEFFKRLFPDKDEGGFKVDSATLQKPEDETPTLVSSSTKTKYKVASCQSTGKERVHNEDTLFTLNCLLDGLDSTITFGVFLVADGMGGHQSGEVASRLAVQGASQFLIDRLFKATVYDQEPIEDIDLQQMAKQAVDEAQNLIQRRVPGGGTTLTLVVAVGDQLVSAHVGDSRLYLRNSNDKLELITKDHSLVKRLVDLGEISEQQASTHPQRNVLYRALGQSDPFDADIESFSLVKGAGLMICSDGLWGVLTEQQMQGIIVNASSLEDGACDLVDAANLAGGPDNISVVLVDRVG